MLTLGHKEAVVNAPSFFEMSIDGSILDIKHFGKFSSNQIIKSSGQRSTPAQYCGLMFTCPSADDIGLKASQKRQPVIVRIGIVTSRNAIHHGVTPNVMSRPISFEVPVGDADTGADISTLLIAQFEKHDTAFPEGKLPFTWEQDQDKIYLKASNPDIYFNSYVSFTSASTGAVPLQIGSDGAYPGVLAKDANDDLIAIVSIVGDTVTMSGGHNLIVGDRVKFYENATTLTAEYTVASISSSTVFVLSEIPSEAPMTDSVLLIRKTSNRESIGGAWVEENIMLGTCGNAKPYVISPGELPKIAEKYTAVSWSILSSDAAVGNAQMDKMLSRVPGEAVGDVVTTFTMYFNENTCLAGDGPVFKLVTWLMNAASADISKFLIANGNQSTSVGDFIS